MKRKLKNRSSIRNQRGIAMLLVLIAVAMAAVLSLTFLSAQATSTGVARNVNRHAQARAITESGLLMALHEVQTNDNWRTDYSDGVWATNQSFTGGNFTIWGQDGQDTDGDGIIEGDSDLADDSSDPVTLTVTGQFESVTHTAQLVVTPSTGKSSSGSIYTLAARERIVMYGNSIIDSFDSSRGAYGRKNRGSNAVVSTNSTRKAYIYIMHRTRIMGDAYVGVGGNPKRGIRTIHGAKVTGERKVLPQNVPMPTIKLPSLGVTNSGNLRYASGTTTISSDLICNKFELRNNAIVQISGDVTIIVNKSVKLKNNAKLKILDGGTLTIYSRGKFYVYDSSQVNYDSADPTRLIVNHMPSKYLGFYGKSNTYATIAAPKTTLIITQSAQVYGTVLSRKIEMSVNAKFHQDIRSIGGGGGGSDATVRWVER